MKRAVNFFKGKKHEVIKAAANSNSGNWNGNGNHKRDGIDGLEVRMERKRGLEKRKIKSAKEFFSDIWKGMKDVAAKIL